ncbi:MAG: type II/IV secretion system ATPase subunit [Chloroflexi bacterium]|nr:type II/IV secretion system ATPase subunit [Chloroflexota bacterium]
MQDIGVPEYSATLGRKHKDVVTRNIMYPAGKGVFVHIKADFEDSRDFYIAIEPDRLPTLDGLIREVDIILMEFDAELRIAIDTDSRSKVLLEILNKICIVSSDAGKDSANGNIKRTKNNQMRVTPKEMIGLQYLIIREKIGLGPLQPVISDPYIEDISCSGVGGLFVEHKIFGGLKASVGFATSEALDGFVIGLSERIGRPVTFREPIVDAVLPDGSRVNIVYGGDVSKRGSNFTIRKFASTPLSILDLISFGGLTYEMAAYLSYILREELNFFVSGETASGKTTLINACSGFINPTSKIVSIEDTPELQVPHKNWVREVVRGTSKAVPGQDSSVTMMDLLKAALRQRPNWIIIGEIRGEEGAIAFQAMQTGHACCATFHASSVEKLIQRITGHPISVPKTYVDNLNVVVIASAVRLPNGKPGRKVISISEITGYDPSSDSFSYVEVFRWNPVTDKHEFPGFQNSYMLEQVIAPKRGFTQSTRRKIYDELNVRANVLRKLHEKGITNFYDFYNVLAKAYREGLFR